MVDVLVDSQQIFLTYADVREENPDWSEKMIQDYLAVKGDLLETAEETSDIVQSETGADPLTMALINDIRRQIGSGNFLTSDDTGFTVDSDKLSVDMDEA